MAEDFRVIPADRTKGIKYAVRDVVVAAKEVEEIRKDMIYLNIGDPNKFGFTTPGHMIEAVNRAMHNNHNGYAPSEGTPEAVQAVKNEAERVGIRPHHAMITTGGSEAIDMALSALLNPGENVLTPSPGYPLYTAVLSRLGAKFNPYLLNEDDGWQPDLDDIRSRVNKNTKAIIIINPNNPTGSVATRECLEGILEIARENKLVVFSDEIYDKLLLDDDEHLSIASLASDVPVLTFNGLSKSYLTPGWRIGWMIASGPEKATADYVQAIMKLARARLSSSHPMQHAVKAALEGPQDHLEEFRKELKVRRDVTVKKLGEIPNVKLTPPRGAFYAFPSIDVPESDHDFVLGLIRETGVVTVHGEGFGQKPGTSHFRVVFLPEEKLLEEAFGRIREYMGSR